MPLSSGPTLFFASGPTEWHGRHFLNEVSPAARSCASAGAEVTAITAAASTNSLVMGGPFNGIAGDENPGGQKTPAQGLRRRGWLALAPLSTGNSAGQFPQNMARSPLPGLY